MPYIMTDMDVVPLGGAQCSGQSDACIHQGAFGSDDELSPIRHQDIF